MALTTLLSRSEVEDGVWRVSYRGNYADLCVRFGQELIEDVNKVATAKCSIEKMLEEMQTPEGRDILGQVIGWLSQFESRVTKPQQDLRDICEKMNFKGSTCRPNWANGAHVFVKAAIAYEIKDMFQTGDLSKGVVVLSSEYRELIDRAISDRSVQCAHPRLNNASAVQVPLPIFSKNDANSYKILQDPSNLQNKRDRNQAWVDSLWSDASFIRLGESTSERMTHTTGSLPHGREASKSWGSAAYKNFTLKKSSTDTSERLNKARSGSDDGYDRQDIETAGPDARSQPRSSADDEHGSPEDNDVEDPEEEQYWASFSKVLQLRFGWNVDKDELRAIARTCYSPDAELAETVFTIDEDEEYLEPLPCEYSISFVDFAAKNLEDFVAPTLKSAEALASFVEGRISVMTDIMHTFIQSASPAHEVTALIGAEKKTFLGHMERLKTAGHMCFEQDALRKVLRPGSASQKKNANSGLVKAFEESLSAIVKEVSERARRLFEKAYRKEHRKLDKQITAGFTEDASKVVAMMEKAVASAICCALTDVDAPSVARKAWAESKDAYRRKVKTGQQKNTGTRPSTIPYNKGYAETVGGRNDCFHVSAEV